MSDSCGTYWLNIQDEGAGASIEIFVAVASYCDSLVTSSARPRCLTESRDEGGSWLH